MEIEDRSPGDTEGDVHLSSAGEVKGVEGHLRGRFPDALGRQETHGLTGVTQRPLPLLLQQFPQPTHTHTDTHNV